MTAPGLKLVDMDGELVPEVPNNIDEVGIAPEILHDLVLRMAYTVPHFTTARAAQVLRLPTQLVSKLLVDLKDDKFIENLGAAGPLDYRFAVTDRGRNRARMLMEMSKYVGPAPVPLEAYTRYLEKQLDALPDLEPDQIENALSGLVLHEDAVHIAGLAGSSRRSLFMYGPPGNGKTSIGHQMHTAIAGDLWVPYCIGVDSSVIRIFDPQFHEEAPLDISEEAQLSLDGRWVRIKRPFIVVGGELTMEQLDLGYSPNVGYYEAPLHLKANGGTFLLDDLGHQQVDAQELLGRWVFPLERNVDMLSLQTGQKLQVPFRQMLVVSTNIDPETMLSPAFMRRMGYKLYVGNPDSPTYAQIFAEYAAAYGLFVPSDVIDGLLERYKRENRPMRGCEPRDLIERVRDLCHFHKRPLELSPENLHLAWIAYFGNGPRQN